MYKDKNGKLNLGPVWDFNMSFGNVNYADGWETFGLQVRADLVNDKWQNPFWRERIMGDENFTQALRCRWNELFADVLSTENIVATFDSLFTLLDEPAARNFERWPVLNEWLWPNYYVAPDYQSEIDWLTNWIRERMRTLNLSVPVNCDAIQTTPVEFACETYPNPFRQTLKLKFEAEGKFYRFQLFDTNGMQVREFELSAVEGENPFELDLHGLVQGVYIYRISYGEQQFTGKVVKM